MNSNRLDSGAERWREIDRLVHEGRHLRSEVIAGGLKRGWSALREHLHLSHVGRHAHG